MTLEQGAFGWLAKQGLNWIGKGRLPQTSGRLRLKGLRRRVEVIRDGWGVPHIYAENEADLFFAQGFVHAQDRFWQMEFQRRLVAGRLAELLGPAGLASDRWMRVLGLYRVAEREVTQVTGSDRQALEAYAAGVNAWLNFRRYPVELKLLRSEPEPWRLADSLAWSKMMAWMLSTNWECELVREQIIHKLGSERFEQMGLNSEESWPLVLTLPDLLHLEQNLARLARPWASPGAGDGVGSNNWVVSGQRTASGKPLLANDMHLLLSQPAAWYENHLVSENLAVTGVSLPGLPLVIAGHNGRVAWGLTAGFADTQDLYRERLRAAPEGGVLYAFRGEWLAAEVRREEIRVRAGASHVEQVVVTRHGPVISPLLAEAGVAPDTPLALCWTASETSGGTLRAMAAMNRAGNCAEFHQALRTWNAPVLNMVYADCDGNIGYTLAGKVPIRAGGEGRVPVPGWTGENEWSGYIPFEELPHLENPSAGVIVTANNRTVGPEYPYYLGRDYVTGDRAERITELLFRQPRVDLAYFQQMQVDQVSPSAQTLARVAGRLQVTDPALARLVERLRGWDGRLAASSPEAALYEALSRQLIQVVFENRLGELLPRFAGAALNEITPGNLWGQHAWEWLRREVLRPDSPWFDLGHGETRADALCLALRRAAAQLSAELGPDPERWQWGRVHTLTFRHILGQTKPLASLFNRGPYPIGGDGNTIWATATLLDRMHSLDGMVGPPFRFLADLSDLSQSLGVLAPGQSGQVGSRHYDDQIAAWLRGAYRPMLYRRADVLRHQESRLELLP